MRRSGTRMLSAAGASLLIASAAVSTCGSASASGVAPRTPVTGVAPFVSLQLLEGTPSVGMVEDYTVSDHTQNLPVSPLDSRVFVLGDDFETTMPEHPDLQAYGPAGSAVWSLPTGSTDRTLFGFSTTDLRPSDLRADDENGPVVSISLSGVRGSAGAAAAPGEVLANTSGVEDPEFVNALMSSLPDEPTTVPFVPGYNLPLSWTFTAAGGYCLDFVATATLADGSPLTWPTATAAIAVGDETDPATVVCGGEPPANVDPTPPPSLVSSTTRVEVAGAGRYGAAGRAAVEVKAADGQPLSGTVTVSVDDAPVGTGNIVGGAAHVLLPRSLGAGIHRVTATYSGAVSTSRTVSGSTAADRWRIAKATTRAAVRGPRKVTDRQRALVKLQVRSTASRLPVTGKVRIRDGRKVIRTIRLTARHDGTRNLRLPALPAGTHRLTATYEGSKDTRPDRSRTLTVHITRS